MEPPNGGPACLIESLPDNILADILSRSTGTPKSLGRLCQLRTVCKGFQNAVRLVEDLYCGLDEARLSEMRLVRFLQESERSRVFA